MDEKESAERPVHFYGYTVVGAASLIMVLIFSVHYSFGIFFVPMLTEFGWTRAMTSGAFSLVWIAQGLLSIVMGGFNDKYGPRMVLTVCGVMIGSGYLLMSQVHTIAQLYLCYGVIVGAGLGGTYVPLTSTAARWFVARRGAMSGLVTAGVGVGGFLGPLASSRLIGAYDWRVSYMILGSIALVGGVSAAQLLKRDPSDVGARPFGEATTGPARPATRLVGFSLKEAASTTQFWIVTAVFFCFGFSLSAILVHLAPNVTDLGISASRAATVLAISLGASIAGKLLLGSATDRIGCKQVYLLSFVLMTASLLWLVSARELWALTLVAMLFGIAYGGLAAAHSPIVAWLFGMKQHGLIFGVLFNGFTVGCALGPIVAGHFFDVSHNYREAFLICSATSAAGLFLTLTLTPVAVAAKV